MSSDTITQPDRVTLAPGQRLLVKIGTRLVTSPQGGLDMRFLDHLARQIALLRDRNVETLIVTSGAVHLGRQVLPHAHGKESLAYRQAAAAIGQPELMRNYAQAFAAHGLIGAQVLLTMDDMVHRHRYVNVRNELDLLLHNHIVPIINENDSVSVEGVTFVENDKLAAIVATKMKVSLLLLLSDQPGLCTDNPLVNPEAKLICRVLPGEEPLANIGDVGGAESRGGMQAKMQAARMVANCGIPVVMADGRKNDILLRAAEGQDEGTYFVPDEQTMSGKKAWLATVNTSVGELKIDAGAARALRQPDGASLLPKGITGVTGTFERHAFVTVSGHEGEVARGEANYSADEIRRIMGHHTKEIATILGDEGPEEVIHRDNMVMTAE